MSFMAIPIQLEPVTWRGWCAEACCFCHEPTRYWTSLLDRAVGGQVACCPFCAETFDADVVPTKDEWIDYWREQAKEGR